MQNGKNNEMSVDVMQEMVSNLINITTKSVDKFSLMSSQMETLSSVVGGMITKVGKHDSDIETIGDRLTTLEENSEIKDEQAKTIIHICKSRIREILGYDDYEELIYFRTFITRLYSYLRKYKGLGSRVATTPKRNYQNVIDAIDSWVPTQGIANLKSEIDKKNEAKAKVKAKQMGY